MARCQATKSSSRHRRAPVRELGYPGPVYRRSTHRDRRVGEPFICPVGPSWNGLPSDAAPDASEVRKLEDNRGTRGFHVGRDAALSGVRIEGARAYDVPSRFCPPGFAFGQCAPSEPPRFPVAETLPRARRPISPLIMVEVTNAPRSGPRESNSIIPFSVRTDLAPLISQQ